MAKKVRRYISQLLEAYEEHTQKSRMEMSLDFDITPSNLYLYFTEKGNPTADTIDKIINGVEENCPEILEEVGR